MENIVKQDGNISKKGNAITVTGRGGPQGWETSKRLYFLDNRLRWRWGFYPYAPATLYHQGNSWYSFLVKAEAPQSHSTARRTRSTEKSNDLIGNRTRDLPTCSIVPQRITEPRDPLELYAKYRKNYKNVFLASIRCNQLSNGWQTKPPT
jgi:hypothetical protein